MNTGTPNSMMSVDENSSSTVDLNNIMTLVTAAHVAPSSSASVDGPMEHSNYLTNASFTMRSLNRIPDKKEAQIIREITKEDLEEIQAAYPRLKKRMATTAQWERVAGGLKNSIILLSTNKDNLRTRLEANSICQQKLLSVISYSIDDIENKERRADFNYSDNSSVYSQEINRLKDEARRLKEEENRIDSQIAEAETNFVAAKSSLVDSQIAQNRLCDYILQVKSQLDQRLSRLSVARRLPDEILLEIFDQFIQFQIDFIIKKARGFTSGRAVLFLASICRRWSHIVYSRPSLWRYIPIQPLSWDNSLKTVVEDIKFYFEKAVGTKKIILHWPPGWHTIKAEHPLFPLHPSEFFVAQPVEDLPTFLTQLSHLELIGYRKDSQISNVVLTQALGKYRIHNLYADITSEVAASTKHFSLRGAVSFQPQRLCTHLHQLAKVTSLCVQFGSPRKPVENPQHIQMPQLAAVSLSIDDLDTMLGSYVSTPILSRLCLRMDPRKSLTPNIGFINASNFPSQVLHLDLSGSISRTVTFGYYQPFISLCNQTKCLELRGPYFALMVQELTQKIDLLPRLQDLMFHDTNIPDDAIQKLLEARKSTNDCESIQTVVFDHCTNVSRGFCEELAGEVASLKVYC